MTRRLGFVLLFLMLFVSGCGNSLLGTAGEIVTPAHNPVPLAGKWLITQDLSAENSSPMTHQTLIGQMAEFSQKAAAIGGQVWLNPSYKIKKVTVSDYVLSKYINLPGNLVDYGKTVSVITVSTADNFVGDIMKLDDRSALAFMPNQTFYLQKTSDSVDSTLASIAEANIPKPGQPDKSSASGVLLGLRSLVPKSGKGDFPSEYAYRTLWIALDQGQLHPILQNQDIFFPRRNGFWKLKVRRLQQGNTMEDKLLAYNVTAIEPGETPLALADLQWQDKNGFFARTVDYIGNDYVAIENNGSGEADNGYAWADHRLLVLPVDHIAATIGIKLSDLVDKNGLTAFNKARSQALQSLARQGEGAPVLETGDPEQDFGLTRKNGHWFLRGRLENQRDGETSYTDFGVNFLPPSKFISYDTLYLSWQMIKDKVPDAIDAYTSPNRDLALILTKSKLYIYPIKQGRLQTESLSQINLKEEESVVMAEWATGAYVGNWEKSFSANGAK